MWQWDGRGGEIRENYFLLIFNFQKFSLFSSSIIFFQITLQSTLSKTLYRLENKKEETLYNKISKQQQFNFEDAVRCQQYEGQNKNKLTKTGTTIVGLVFKDGVIVCADQRASAGHFVADKHCKKLFQLAPNMVCAGAGTAADAQNVKMMVADQLKLLQQTYDLKPQVAVAQTLFVSHLFRYGGNISAALICGGYDIDGPHIVAINPEGSYNHVPYATLGSGSLAAQSVLDTYYRENLTLEEAREIGIKAITAGIINDEGSGSAVDMAIITKDNCQMFRSIVKPGDESKANWQLYK